MIEEGDELRQQTPVPPLPIEQSVNLNDRRESFSQFYNQPGDYNDQPAYEPQMETERDLGSSQDQDE